MKNEAKWHIQSLQAVFEDRVRLLKEQAVKSDDSVIKAQRQMGSEVRVGVHCTALHCTALHTALHCSTYCTALLCIPLLYLPLDVILLILIPNLIVHLPATHTS